MRIGAEISGFSRGMEMAHYSLWRKRRSIIIDKEKITHHNSKLIAHKTALLFSFLVYNVSIQIRLERIMLCVIFK